MLRFLRTIPPHERRLTISTWLTLGRIALVPAIVVAMVTHQWGVAFGLFVVASITDVLDGNVARWRNEQTFLGACLDPIADKLLLVSCFFTLAFVHTPLFSIPHWFVVLMLVKELIIIGGACCIYLVHGKVTIEPTRLGKMTTLLQVLFIVWLFACYFFQWVPIKTYYVMLSMVLAVVALSFMQYLYIGMGQIKDK